MPRYAALLSLWAVIGACSGFITLFDGASLAGWQVSGEARWSVEDASIVASGQGDGFLASRAEYGDFQLQVEFWVDATTNSGIMIRCKNRARIYPDTCYELNIWDHHPQQEARTGAIVFEFMPPLAQVETIGRWNRYEVMARGEIIEVKVNGELTARLEGADPTAGFIALQHFEQGEVRFRSLKLRPL